WVRDLLDAGAEVDLRDEAQATPLYRTIGMFAANWAELLSNGCMPASAVQSLPVSMRASASPFVADQIEAEKSRLQNLSADDRALLSEMEASFKGENSVRRQLVDEFLAHGADVNAVVGDQGHTPFL